MRVFISWSGELSKKIGQSFRDWLPTVLQAVKPYFSPDDIAKGARWNEEISKELEASTVGLFILTRSNLDAPWLLFEAGAISKKLDRSRVCPILFDLDPTDIKGPLEQFQSAKFGKAEVKKLVRMINEQLATQALSTETFESVFDMWWPKLEEKVQIALARVTPDTHAPQRSERDLLEEILMRLRRFPHRLQGQHSTYDPGYVVSLIDALADLSLEVFGTSPTINAHCQKLIRLTRHFANRAELPDSAKTKLQEMTTILLNTDSPDASPPPSPSQP